MSQASNVKAPTILISPGASTLMRDAAARMLAVCRQSITTRGVFHVALSGGNTPNALFQLLATAEYAPQFDWPRVHLWWSDERYLPPDSPDCNFNMAYEALIGSIDIPAANVHRVRVELPVEQAAAEYAADIARQVETPAGAALPAFDLILLGLGEDGHTASCFPGVVAELNPDRLVDALFVPQVAMWRITFTPGLINAARYVFFLVSGASKVDILQRVIRGPYQPDVLPSQLVAPAPGELVWLVDRDAADGNF